MRSNVDNNYIKTVIENKNKHRVKIRNGCNLIHKRTFINLQQHDFIFD